MQKTLLLFVIVFIFLLILPTTQGEELPNEDKIAVYINELIKDYNALIKAYERDKQEFNEYKKYYSLYCEVGKTFKVLCVKASEYDNESVALFFEPISGNNPLIYINFSYNVPDFLPVLGFQGRIEGIFDDIFLDNPDVNIFSEYLLLIPSEKIINDTRTNADNFADYIYENDKLAIEKAKKEPHLEKIKKTWNYFINDSINIVFAYQDSLLEMFNDISNKVNWNQYETYELFEIGFNPLNRSVTHFKEQTKMQMGFNQLVIDVSNTNYYFLFWCNDFNQIFSSELNEIEDNINNNESYLYEDFLQSKFVINQNIQNKIKTNEKYEENWYKAIIIFIMIFITIYLLIHIIMIKTSKKKWTEISISIITLGFGFIGGLVSNKLLEFNIGQVIFVISSIPFACIIYYILRKKRKTKQKNKTKKPKKK